ncbi:MAG: hybrid sensor histidine kinase/response regulator [Verrucomicrobia bacterium]|nr:hybrid sensor histidine kinase/response regulator [Verrucomicrobiota bacterium]
MPQKSSNNPPASTRQRATLLVVDDEPGPRDSLKMVFKDDFELLITDNGAAAIELAKNNKVDVALVDIRMAGMSGVEVLERIKFVDPTIEVIMMTAFETTDTIRQALRLRASEYINKPWDVATLRAAVSAAMQRRTLESEVHNNTEKLEQLMKELQEQQVAGKMAQARGDIYASIIHDINGPLTVISGFLQILNARLHDRATLEGEEVVFLNDKLRTMTRQVTNCIEISRRYLGFLRRQPGEGSRVGVNQLLADLGHLIRVHPSLQENEFEYRPLAQDIGVKVNGTDVIQLLLNLTVNAFQCAPQSHRVDIEGESLHEPLDLTKFKDSSGSRLLNVENFQNEAPLVRISVRDDGPGIPAEVLPKIFQPYFTTKDARQGTGLGLNIVQRLVKESGGALHVETRQGKGTTFTVYLPAVPVAK